MNSVYKTKLGCRYYTQPCKNCGEPVSKLSYRSFSGCLWGHLSKTSWGYVLSDNNDQGTCSHADISISIDQFDLLEFINILHDLELEFIGRTDFYNLDVNVKGFALIEGSIVETNGYIQRDDNYPHVICYDPEHTAFVLWHPKYGAETDNTNGKPRIVSRSIKKVLGHISNPSDIQKIIEDRRNFNYLPT